jgi:hypothetical protein
MSVTLPADSYADSRVKMTGVLLSHEDRHFLSLEYAVISDDQIHLRI